jgi:hypothetical protein
MITDGYADEIYNPNGPELPGLWSRIACNKQFCKDQELRIQE